MTLRQLKSEHIAVKKSNGALQIRDTPDAASRGAKMANCDCSAGISYADSARRHTEKRFCHMTK
jgi:hypothetical protein